jgi:DNA-binding protein H-NS
MKNVDEIIASIDEFSLDDLDRLEKAANESIKRKLADEEKLLDIINFAKSKGVELNKEDLQPTKVKDGRRLVKDKYSYTDDDGKEWLWSGRGRTPKWAKNMSVKELDSYQI